MFRLDVKDFMTAFRAYRKICRGEHVALTHKGKAIAGIIPMNDLTMLESMQQEKLKDVLDEFDPTILQN